MADRCPEIHHLHRRQRRLKSFVAHFQPCAINRLLQRFASEDSERVRDSSLLSRLADAARNLVHNDVVVRRVAAQQTADANNRMVFPSLRELARGDRDFKRTRDSNERNVFFLSARTKQSIVSTLKKPL